MKSTGQNITEIVQSFLADQVSQDREGLTGNTVHRVYTKKLGELADYLGVSPNYMPRKMKSGTWDSDELDKLAKFFDTWPGVFVPGPEQEKTE